MKPVTPCLWLDGHAEEAAELYTEVFPDSRINQITHYGEEAARASGRPVGSVLTVAFDLNSQPFLALNGGPHFRFSEAVSFVVNCGTQQEIDKYWERLCEGGEAGQCGWLKDRFGVSWQIVPAGIGEWLNSEEPERASRVMSKLLGMKKIDIATLEDAYRES